MRGGKNDRGLKEERERERSQERRSADVTQMGCSMSCAKSGYDALLYFPSPSLSPPPPPLILVFLSASMCVSMYICVSDYLCVSLSREFLILLTNPTTKKKNVTHSPTSLYSEENRGAK